MTKDRAGNHGISLMFHPPQLLTGGWIIRINGSTGRTDNLPSPFMVDEERGAERKVFGKGNTASCFPGHFSGFLEKSHHKGVARPITAEDQLVIHHDGRTTTSMNRVIF